MKTRIVKDEKSFETDDGWRMDGDERQETRAEPSAGGSEQQHHCIRDSWSVADRFKNLGGARPED